MVSSHHGQEDMAKQYIQLMSSEGTWQRPPFSSLNIQKLEDSDAHIQGDKP